MSLSDPPFPYRRPRTVWVRGNSAWHYRSVLLASIAGVLFWIAVIEVIVAIIEWRLPDLP